MIKLIKFTEDDFETFKSWIKNEEELFQFAGSLFTFPITNQQLLSYIKNENLKPFKVILSKTNATIGHCELNFKNGNNRLSRILIGKKNLRGKKIGEKIVIKMCDILFEDISILEVDLNVFDWNKSAIKCYKNASFKISNSVTKELTVKGRTWARLNMILKREDYNNIKKVIND